ncbi:MAG: S9 family peptidase [Paludibacteraceae bacterium]|nr:S9 family peptidase [Paludibacteraceae bacterium]
MKKVKIIFMALIALMSAACSKEPQGEVKQPITKPQITIDGGRLTAEALWAMGRIGEVEVDIETGWIAYTVSYYSVSENRSTTWVRIAAEENGRLKTMDEFVGNSPAWWGNSGTLAYLRDGKLYIRQNGQDLAASGYDKEIEGFLLSPYRDKILLNSAVKTVKTTADKYPDLPLASGRVIDDLMYKHWDEWVETSPQPFLAEMKTKYNKGELIMSLEISNATNILEGTAYESPMRPFGGVEQWSWSPDGKQIAYTCRKKTGMEYAVSTNSDIYLHNIETGEETNMTEGNGGYDLNPAYSPDGEKIAWLSMERDGYESDETHLMVYDLNTGQKTFLSEKMGTAISDFYWHDNEHIILSAVWHGTEMLYRLDMEGNVECLTEGQYDFVPVKTYAEMAPEETMTYCLRHSMCEANEIYKVHVDVTGEKKTEQLTYENQNIYDQITMGTVVPRWQKTTDGKEMLTWIILPPDFDETKKYPALLYCEGGPQSPVSQFWSYRWNFMMMSANDYVIVAPNRRGLPGFGKEWNEEISGDYGGQCMKDYFTAIDEACDSLPYIDRDRLGCVGASFGGFSVYWIAGHHNKRFKAFIAHDGIFNMEMQYLETEEKWFANWDMGGAYWEKDNAVAQRTFENSPHRFVDKWDTPILCIHSERDYRILANQGMAAFDAAKMRGIPAELLIYPDENHWVLKPQNGILWQRTFFGWLDRWLKNQESESSKNRQGNR